MAVALIALLVFFMMRRGSKADSALVVPNALYSTVPADTIAVPSQRSSDAGQYQCSVCQKSYAIAEDLAAHVQARHA